MASYVFLCKNNRKICGYVVINLCLNSASTLALAAVIAELFALLLLIEMGR
jgi:hypothetical protein